MESNQIIDRLINLLPSAERARKAAKAASLIAAAHGEKLLLTGWAVYFEELSTLCESVKQTRALPSTVKKEFTIDVANYLATYESFNPSDLRLWSSSSQLKLHIALAKVCGERRIKMIYESFHEIVNNELVGGRRRSVTSSSSSSSASGIAKSAITPMQPPIVVVNEDGNEEEEEDKEPTAKTKKGKGMMVLSASAANRGGGGGGGGGGVSAKTPAISNEVAQSSGKSIARRR